MAALPAYEDGATEAQEVVARQIRSRRGGMLLNLDRMLLHSAPFAEGFNALLPKVRYGLSLPERCKELAILATVVDMQASYEIFYHSPLFLAAGGSQAQIDALSDLPRAADDRALFDNSERAILTLALESTRTGSVAPATIAAVRETFPSPQQTFELVSVIATYNMVARILLALDVELDS